MVFRFAFAARPTILYRCYAVSVSQCVDISPIYQSRACGRHSHTHIAVRSFMENCSRCLYFSDPRTQRMLARSSSQQMAHCCPHVRMRKQMVIARLTRVGSNQICIQPKTVCMPNHVSGLRSSPAAVAQRQFPG